MPSTRTRPGARPARRPRRCAPAARADAAFDRLLPAALQQVSDDYWTPIPVVRRVAGWLRAERVRTVVDIGSGCGKFCVAAPLLAPCHVIGLEQRRSLVVAARALAAACDVADRVTFLSGAFGVTPPPRGDAYYLFNPFGEYEFGSARYADAGVVYTWRGYQRSVAAMTRFLAAAPTGTVVITYNGFGGTLPSSYEQVDVDVSFRGALRLWKKRVHVPGRPAAGVR